MMENNCQTLEHLKQLRFDGFCYDNELSDSKQLTFVKKQT